MVLDWMQISASKMGPNFAKTKPGKLQMPFDVVWLKLEMVSGTWPLTRRRCAPKPVPEHIPAICIFNFMLSEFGYVFGHFTAV